MKAKKASMSNPVPKTGKRHLPANFCCLVARNLHFAATFLFTLFRDPASRDEGDCRRWWSAFASAKRAMAPQMK